MPNIELGLLIVILVLGIASLGCQGARCGHFDGDGSGVEIKSSSILGKALT